MSQVLPAADNEVGKASTGSPAQSQARSRERVDYIEYFRAVAIVMIVFGHSFDLAWTRSANEHVQVSTSALGFVSALLNGGTFYFVFISGFLYRYVFFERVSYGDFLRKKALYVGLPYLLIGTVLAFLQMGISDFHVTINKHGTVLGENVFVDLVTQLATGAMMTAYWYIPFIFVVFLASPLFDRFIRLPLAGRIAVFLASLAVAFWVHRPYENLDPIHSFIYFVHFYLFGMLFAEYRKPLMSVLKTPLALILLAVLLVSTALAQDLVLHNISNIERVQGDGWWPKGFDLIIIQKYVGVFFFCGLLARWGERLDKALVFVAENSFGLYFAHGIILTALTHLPSIASPHLGVSLIDFLLYGLVTFTFSFAMVLLVKQATGRYSRYVIGC